MYINGAILAIKSYPAVVTSLAVVLCSVNVAVEPESETFLKLSNLVPLNLEIRYCLSVEFVCVWVYPSSSLGWRYGVNGNSGSCRQPN